MTKKKTAPTTDAPPTPLVIPGAWAADLPRYYGAPYALKSITRGWARNEKGNPVEVFELTLHDWGGPDQAVVITREAAQALGVAMAQLAPPDPAQGRAAPDDPPYLPDSPSDLHDWAIV